MTTIALVGATGFVGSHVRAALEQRGAHVVGISAPRLSTTARTVGELDRDIEQLVSRDAMLSLREDLRGCDAVVNAAGVANATGNGDALFGANALLPGLLASLIPGHIRFVHVSSAAVQGRRNPLDESEQLAPFSPYSSSKALGEMSVRSRGADNVIYRPTSVQGSGRDVTRSLVRLLRSPAASVAGNGDAPTPQVLVQNVADAVAFLALEAGHPPSVVLHPSEWITTGDLVRLLGERTPLRVPTLVARAVIGLGFTVGRLIPAGAGVARRLEILWLGQDQAASWLDGRWSAPLGREAWKELR